MLLRDKLEHLVGEMVERGILFEDAVQAFERAFIAAVLERTDGNLCEAARQLRVHRNTLARKVNEHKLRQGRGGGAEAPPYKRERRRG